MDCQRIEWKDFFRALVQEFAETCKSFFEGRHSNARLDGQVGIFREDEETFPLREQVHAETERFEQTFGRVVDGDASDGVQKWDVDFGNGTRQPVAERRRQVELTFQEVAAQVVGRERRVEHVGVNPGVESERDGRAHRDRSERTEMVGDEDCRSARGQFVRAQQVTTSNEFLESPSDQPIQIVVHHNVSFGEGTIMERFY